MTCKRLYKSRKKCEYIYYLLNKHKIFLLFGLCLQRLMENLCTAHPTAVAFMVRDIMALNGIFSILPVAGLFKPIVYLKICHWISKQVFYRTGILLFVLIPRYGCFGVTYMSNSVELKPCHWELYQCIRVQDVLKGSLKFKSLSKTFFKCAKWPVNNFQTEKMNVATLH